MSGENMRAILMRYYDKIWNQGRLEVCDDLIAPDYVNHSAPLPDLPPGPEGLKQTVAAVRRAFPDVHYAIEDMVIGEDKAALRVTMRGTHSGEFLGAAPTGRTIEVQELQIEHLRDGRIIAHWHQIDDLGMQRQLGLLPPLPGSQGRVPQCLSFLLVLQIAVVAMRPSPSMVASRQRTTSSARIV